MKTRAIMVAALMAGASLGGGLAVNAASESGTARHAAAEARNAGRALAKHKPAKAVAAAEAAVAMSPRTPAYRTLLGQAYLASGRFPSAVGALGDALSLDPSDGVAALHLVLAKIATGDWAGARETLVIHETTIPASDRGLAFALAGDPVMAVGILTDAARTPGATAKTRQNLALALGLAGRWQEAKTVAAFDVAPDKVDARLMQWMAFARPRGAADQVASLLGVTPVEDGGQPERLALRTTSPAVAAVAQATPVSAPVAARIAQPAAAVALPAAQTISFSGVVPEPPAPAEGAGVSAAGASVAPPPVAAAAVPQAPRASVAAPAPKPAAKPGAPASRPIARVVGKGNWYVQLGAFSNAAVAHDAWGRMTRRHRALGTYAPNGMSFTNGGANFYRLSVGGFARGDADALCRRVRTGGGACFVRAGAGDAIASWVRPGVQLAMR